MHHSIFDVHGVIRLAVVAVALIGGLWRLLRWSERNEERWAAEAAAAGPRTRRRAPMDVVLRIFTTAISVVVLLVVGYVGLWFFSGWRRMYVYAPKCDRGVLVSVAVSLELYRDEHGLLPDTLRPITSEEQLSWWGQKPGKLRWFAEGECMGTPSGRDSSVDTAGEGIVDAWGWPYLYCKPGRAGERPFVAGRGANHRWDVAVPESAYSAHGALPAGDDVVCSCEGGEWILVQTFHRVICCERFTERAEVDRWRRYLAERAESGN